MIQNQNNAVETTPAQNNDFAYVDATATTRTTTVAEFTRGASAFYEGRTFKFKDVEKRIFLKDEDIARRDKMLAEGKTIADFIETLPSDRRVAIVFTTDIEDDSAVVWLSSYTPRKTKLDRENKPVLRDGNFDKVVYETLANANPNDDLFEVAKRILSQFEGKTITVRRKFYRNRFETASIPCFEA